MPFTTSHPAIVLPLGLLPKRFVSTTGLVIGSMAPDFEYFLRLRILSYYSHSWWGTLYFDLPLSLALSLLFHTVVRNALIAHLPGFLRNRFAHVHSFNWARHFLDFWPSILASVLIGAASHILWDGFTHRDGMFVKMLPALQANIHYLDFKFPFFKCLQHFSSLVGGLLIAGTVMALPRQIKPLPAGKGIYWLPVVAITGLFCLIRFGIRIGNIDEVIATLISGFLFALTLVSAAHRLWSAKLAKTGG